MRTGLALFMAIVGGVEDAPSGVKVPDAPRIEVSRAGVDEGPAGPRVSYDVRYVSTNQLGWRGKFDPRLRPLARQGGTAIWAVDQSTVEEILAFCEADPATKAVSAPKVSAQGDGEVRFDQGENIHYVAHLERIADGPVNHSTRLAFRPEIAQLHNGVITRLSSGKVEGEGLRASVAIDRDRLLSFQTTSYTETVLPAPEAEGENGRHASGTRRRSRPRPSTLSGTIQVPVVDSARVAGEWVIPKDGALIVSLGTGVKSGKVLGEVRPEELVVIRYRPEPGRLPTPIQPSKTAAATQTGLRPLSAN